MRLAFMGPSESDESLRRAAELLLGSLGAERVVYLGGDDRFERAVGAWFKELAPRGEQGVWDDARSLLEASATPERTQAWLKQEDARLRLRKLEVLPRQTRLSIEMLGSRMALLADDRERLSPEDLAEAQIVIYGKSPSPRARAVSNQWFVSPGELTDESGLAIVEETGDSLRVTFYDPAGKVIGGETLKAFNKTKFTVKEA